MRLTRGDEQGSVTPLIIGFAVVVALLVAVVVDASAAYLRRQGLNSAADAAALAATDGIQGEEVYTHGLGKRAEIDPAAARRYVADYFASSGIRRRFPGLDYSVQTTANTVVVRDRHPDGPAAARARRRHQRADQPGRRPRWSVVATESGPAHPDTDGGSRHGRAGPPTVCVADLASSARWFSASGPRHSTSGSRSDFGRRPLRTPGSRIRMTPVCDVAR